MKIAVVGFTGKVNSSIIEELRKSKTHELAGVLVRSKTNHNNLDFKLYDDILQLAQEADAIIDFTNPTTSLELASKLVNSKTLLVSGTTGFSIEEFDQFKSYAKYFPIIWSANMSVGINIMLSILQTITEKLGEDFGAGIIDIHRKHKKDSPSGTALLLKQEIKKAGLDAEIASLRIGEEKGEHLVLFSSEDESISIKHTALSRNAYVKGAIRACQWGANKLPGFYTMQDVFA